VYAHYRLGKIVFHRPDSRGLHNHRQDEENGAKGGALGSGMQSGVHVREPVQAESPYKIEEQTNSYEHVAQSIEGSH